MACVLLVVQSCNLAGNNLAGCNLANYKLLAILGGVR